MFYTISRFLNSEFARRLTSAERSDLQYLAKIFPFKASRYVLEELIDWHNRDSDPIFRLIFPRAEMLSERHWRMLKSASTFSQEKQAIQKIRHELNPHPDGQKDNIPQIGNRNFGGIQHKYEETVLFFPAQGQTCHSYCTYCFRWAQFVNLGEHKFKSKEHQDLLSYLSDKKKVTDILFTGGDPMWMPNRYLFNYLDVLTAPELHHVQNIRIGTKSLSFYPQRFLGAEGDALLDKFEQLLRKGKSVAIMAHISHPKELQTVKVRQAVQRLKEAGVVLRTQAPLIRGINDDAEVWRDMWNEQVRLGMVPYYMFIERDTGAHQYFSVPLYRAYEIFSEAYAQVSGLAKTVRGPSMSAWPGKVLFSGIMEIENKKKFLLKFIQSRNAELINLPFTARFDENATWFSELEIDSPMKEHLSEMSGYRTMNHFQANGVA